MRDEGEPNTVVQDVVTAFVLLGTILYFAGRILAS